MGKTTHKNLLGVGTTQETTPTSDSVRKLLIGVAAGTSEVQAQVVTPSTKDLFCCGWTKTPGCKWQASSTNNKQNIKNKRQTPINNNKQWQTTTNNNKQQQTNISRQTNKQKKTTSQNINNKNLQISKRTVTSIGETVRQIHAEWPWA